MNIWIVMFMAVWVWAFISDVATQSTINQYNKPLMVALRGGRVQRNKRGRIVRDFVGIGFFIIVAYWLYVWLA